MAQDKVIGGSGSINVIWVAVSSIIPQSPRANTNTTAIMIGERVADWVAGA